MAETQRLVALGVPLALAAEIDRQIEIGAGNAGRLVMAGLPELSAKTLAGQITSGITDGNRLAASGMVPEVAREIMTLINYDVLDIVGTAPAAEVNEPYSFVPTITGGTLPYTVTVSSGSLPGWATLNPTTGAVTGTPDTDGPVAFTLTVTDSDSQTDSLPVSFEVSPDEPDVVNRVLPSITSDLRVQTMVSLDGGEWDGEYDSIEVRLQSTDDLDNPGTVFIDWTDDPAAIGEAEADDPHCYIAARAIVGGNPVSAVINTHDYGPWLAFSQTFAKRVDFRETWAHVTQFSNSFAIISTDDSENETQAGNVADEYPDMSMVAPDTTDWGLGGVTSVSLSDINGSGVGGKRVKGSGSVSSSSAKVVLALPNGWYKVRGTAGKTGTTSGNTGLLAFIDGTDGGDAPLLAWDSIDSKLSDDVQMFDSDDGQPTFNAMSASDAEAIMQSDAETGPMSPAFEITKGALLIRRNPEVSTGAQYFHTFDIITVAQPMGEAE